MRVGSSVGVYKRTGDATAVTTIHTLMHKSMSETAFDGILRFKA
jgi:hypothetical protein